MLLLLELLLAAYGVHPLFIDEDPYVGFSSHSPLFVEVEAANGRIDMVTAKNKMRWFCPQRFPQRKDRSVYRIFCMGGSTTYGRPYNDATSFCAWLRELLPEVDPARRFEVVNAGGISYASYRIGVLMEELVNFAPDLFIIYTGHNEFLERRTYSGIINTPPPVRGLRALASRTRCYSALCILTRNHGPHKDAAAESGRTQLPGEVNALLDRSVGPSAYRRDDQLRLQVVSHFRYSLTRMVEMARSAGAHVILVTPGSNLSDCSPFKSENRAGLEDAALQRWQHLIGQATKASAAENFAQALAALEEAATIDDRYAHLHYLKGRVLAGLKRYGPAKAAFQRALEEDVCSLRAISAIQHSVAQVAAQRRVPLVDFAMLVEQKSTNQIAGNEFFLDHVHPTVEGHRELALAIITTLAEQGYIQPRDAWNQPDGKREAIERVTQAIHGRIDGEAHAAALKNVAKVMSWGGKIEDAYQAALRAVELGPEDAESHFQAGRCAQLLGNKEEAIKHYRRVLQIGFVDPNDVPDYYAETHLNLGTLLVQQGNLEQAVKQYRLALRIQPGSAQAHYNLGVVHNKQNRLEQAADHFQQAIRLEPNFPEALLNLGVVYERRAEFDQAAAQYRKALQVRPNYEMARRLLSQLQRKQHTTSGS